MSREVLKQLLASSKALQLAIRLVQGGLQFIGPMRSIQWWKSSDLDRLHVIREP